jgi:hypothetical protein
MIGVLRALLVAALAAIVFEVAFAPRAAQRPLDPDQPIAADGSMTAGRARTIYDTNPILQAAAEAPRPDPDDPKDFQWLIENDRWNNDHVRDAMAQIIGPVDGSLCESAAHQRLMTAVHNYYDARGREKHSFSLRGPHAGAAMEKEWSTPADHRIDEFVRRAVLSGFLHKNEVLAHYLPEFAKTFADTEEAGAGCPPTKTEAATDGFSPTVAREPGSNLAEPVIRQQ